MGHVHKLPPVVAHAVKAEVQRDLLVQRVQSLRRQRVAGQAVHLPLKAGIRSLLHVIAKAVRHFCPGQVFPAVAQAQILHTRGEEFRHVHPGGAAVAGIVIAEVAELMGKNQLVVGRQRGVHEDKRLLIAGQVLLKRGIVLVLPVAGVVELRRLHQVMGFLDRAAHALCRRG